MNDSHVRERLRFWQVQLSRLRAAIAGYLKGRSHTPMDVIARRRREERLRDILEELAEISSRLRAA